MVTVTTAAQRKKSATKRSSSAKRPASGARRRYRQGFVGYPSLGYPFDPEAVPTRSAARQKVVDEYAKTVLPSGVYSYLKKNGCRWYPSDARLVATYTSDTGKTVARQFIASMYVLDLAYATAENIKSELQQLQSSAAPTTEAKKKLAGIVANLTNTDASAENVTRRILNQLRPTEQVEADARPRVYVTGGALYPFKYTETRGVVSTDRSMNIAHDAFLHYLLKAVENAEFFTENFSLTSQTKVFFPLGLSVNNNRISADVYDEQALTDMATSGAPQINASVASNRDVKVTMPILDYLSNGVSIQHKEMRALNAELNSLYKMAESVARRWIGSSSGNMRDPNMADEVSANTCGAGQMPLFVNKDGKAVPQYLDADGYWIAPGATRRRCVSVRTFKAAQAELQANQAKLKAGQSKARQTPATVTLRQVEALPKKELAKFVQRVVNLA